MPAPPSQAADLLRRAAAAADSLQLDLPDEEIKLPEPLVLHAREIRLRGTGPRSTLRLAPAGPGPGAAVVVQPPAGGAIGRFSIENLTLCVDLQADAGEWSCLHVRTADDQGVASGEIAACRFELLATRPLRDARFIACRIGSDDSDPRAAELRVRMITVRDCLFSPAAGVALDFAHVHGCRAQRNVILDAGPARAAVETLALQLRGAQHCEVRDNAIRRDGGSHLFTALRIAGSHAAPAAGNTVRGNLAELSAPASAVELRGNAEDNVLERNQFIARNAGVAVRLAPGEGAIRRNWLFDNLLAGFSTAVQIDPGDCRGNRLVNSTAGNVEDASRGANVVLGRTPD